MSRIEVRVQGLDALIARFGAAPQQVRRATRSAVARTARGLRASGRRELAASLQVPQRVIGDRVRLRLQMDAPQAGAVVWFGLEPLTVSRKRFGSLRQTRPGAVAAGRLFAGAFVVEKFGAAFRRVGRMRMPIAPERMEIGGAAQRAVIAALARQGGPRLQRELEYALRYETQIRGRR